QHSISPYIWGDFSCIIRFIYRIRRRADMTVLGLIRHGLTDWNKAGKMQGQTDIPLNEEGKRQARALAVYLQQERWRWDRISSSDLQRASATARIISDVLGLGDVHLDPLLRERGFGLAEGMTVAERQAKYGA